MRLQEKAAVRQILQENSFQFNERDYLQTLGTTMATKVAVTFANIFMMVKIEMHTGRLKR